MRNLWVNETGNGLRQCWQNPVFSHGSIPPLDKPNRRVSPLPNPSKNSGISAHGQKLLFLLLFSH